ncbi:MAG TPA: hypothetical protein VEC57_00230 [Candidatus Limnocylindrales bacterium]|nr:hypothetical protein [Candidatus Limnocylindrales bacterium]
MKPANERALDLSSLVGEVWRSAYRSAQEDVENGRPGGAADAWKEHGFFDDKVCVLRRGIMAFADDVARIDYLATHHPNLAVQISRNAISTPPLREAIDREIEQSTELPHA